MKEDPQNSTDVVEKLREEALKPFVTEEKPLPRFRITFASKQRGMSGAKKDPVEAPKDPPEESKEESPLYRNEETQENEPIQPSVVGCPSITVTTTQCAGNDPIICSI